MRVYLAGGIFTIGDELRSRLWSQKLREAFPNIDLYSPIENTDINGKEGKKKFAGSKQIVDGDMARLNNTDILISCLDGDVIPSGTSAETGIMYEKIMRGDHKYIVGIITDNRQCHLTHSAEKDAGGAAESGEQQYSYHNLFVTGLCKAGGILTDNFDDVIAFIKSKEHEFDRSKEFNVDPCTFVYEDDEEEYSKEH